MDKLIRRFTFWFCYELPQLLPVWCDSCGAVLQKKDANYRQMTTGQTVTLRDKCDHKIYHPCEGL